MNFLKLATLALSATLAVPAWANDPQDALCTATAPFVAAVVAMKQAQSDLTKSDAVAALLDMERDQRFNRQQELAGPIWIVNFAFDHTSETPVNAGREAYTECLKW